MTNSLLAFILYSCLVVISLSFRGNYHPLLINKKNHRPKSTVVLLSGTSGTAWEKTDIHSTVQDSIGLRLIDIAVPESIAALYTTAGQYVQIKQGEGKPGYYAVASPPDGRTVFTFLIKETEANAFLTSAQTGSSVDMSAPLGRGFQVKEYIDGYKYDFPSTNLLLLACGSGIAPIAAAIDSGTLGLKSTGFNSLFERKATLYIGARTPDHIPLRSKFAAWEEMGVSIVPVLSKADTTWTGRTGYIQDALSKDNVKVPRNTAALLCGHRGMTDNAKDILLSAGVFEGRILLNF